MNNPPNKTTSCKSPDCGCRGPQLGRRDFIKSLGLGAAALTLQPWNLAMAGPFTRADFENLVPADKKLSPEWVKSLTVRGSRTVYRGEALANIGMPIGGICTGQIYLGGDGRLWHWDIFNHRIGTGADHYAHPLKESSPVAQGFALRVISGSRTQEWAMDAAHWKDVSFIGEYPIGYVAYADDECPLTVNLEAFSPFVPLNAADSSLPATVLEFTLKNTSPDDVEGEFGGWLENAVCIDSGQRRDGIRRNRIVRETDMTFLECGAEDAPAKASGDPPDIVFDDFESGTYGNWTVTGTAFGRGPVEAAKMPGYQGDVGAQGKWLVNTHASAPGNTVEESDSATGRLTSRPFTIERNYINFLIGGGNHEGRTCMNLLVDEQIVLSATGKNDNRMQPLNWDVRQWAGRNAQLVIVDEEKGPWGNIGVDDIMFSDHPREPVGSLAEEEDFGTMGLALLHPAQGDLSSTSISTGGVPPGLFASSASSSEDVKKPFGQKLVGCLTRKFKLAPDDSAKLTFIISWCFPNLRLNRLPPGRHYATLFDSAKSVAAHVVRHFNELASQTRLWHDTWYDSTLPFWFLDRTFLNTSILATSTCHRLGSGRFYSWEGVGCCEGTCGHVWQYAQAVARLFPEFERQLREKVDLGPSMQPNGAIHFRGEFNDIPAIDAQAGVILRSLREHQMSADAAFLKRNWPRIRKASEWLITKDGDGDGLIESNQHNTLDTDWYGKVAWLSGLYQAALLAAQTMANEMDDQDFAAQCGQILAVGRKNFVEQLFDHDEGYFLNRVSPSHADAINSGTGCEIDQVMGQSWAFQVGLPRLFPEKETRAALHSLWHYNFTPDVGPYRNVYKSGRWYAMPGEAGLLMCTFPRSDWDYAQAKGKGPEWAAGYFNECMNGFEYEVAGHMLWEGLLTEGLAVTRAVHDRYHGSRRNPWNEVECGDHYVRSMASYGVYIAACGFEHHGPNGHIGFAPRLTPENFQAAFTAAEGWGTYNQRRDAGRQTHEIEIKQGKLQLKSMALELAPNARLLSITAKQGSNSLAAKATQTGGRVQVTLGSNVVLNPDTKLEVVVTFIS